MNNLPIYQVDAFSETLFGGNPAAVVPLPKFPSETVMQSIATENNLSETAYVVFRGPGKFDIRWFTPTREVRLCGHATLASAHVLFSSAEDPPAKMRFRTREAGSIVVTANDDGSYAMAFSADKPEKIRAPKGLRGMLGGLKPQEVYRGKDDLLVVLKNQKQVDGLHPNLQMVAALKHRGLLVTAPGEQTDVVSRGFYPAFGIDEDPVTGSAHTLLVPYWAERLGRRGKAITFRQGGPRQGVLTGRMKGKKKVELTGRAITYLSGQVLLDRL